MAEAPDILTIAEAWDRLRQAIERVETAGPFRMSADIASLRDERGRFEDLIMGRTARRALKEQGNSDA